MPKAQVLMLTYPPSWAKQLRHYFPPDQVDILVKARRPDRYCLAEHQLYEPASDVSIQVPENVLLEIELSLRRCYAGNKRRLRSLALQIYANAQAMLTEARYRRIVFRTVPHMPHEFAIYHCARALGVDTLFFDETGYFERAFVFNDIYVRHPSSALDIGDRAPFSFTQEQRKIVSLTELRKNYHGLRTVGQGLVRNIAKVARAYLYVIKASVTGDSVAGSAGLSRNISRSNLFDRLVFWTLTIFKTAALRRVLSRLESSGPGLTPLSGSIVFLLNFQPERTTLPDAHPYYDLLDAASELVRTQRQVFVKEHPIQLNFPGDGALLRGATWRSRRFYEDLDQLTGGFLPRTREVDEELAAGNLIATATGTVAVEMFFRRIPVLVLANNWVSTLPNVIRTSSIGTTQSTFTYDPFETFERVFERTVKVIRWSNLSADDVSVLRQIVGSES